MTGMETTHGDLPEGGFASAVIVRADEPDDDTGDGIRVTRGEFELCAPDPLRLMVLLHWRGREQDGRPRSAEAIWSALTELGVCSDDGESPVSLEEVRQAVDFLRTEDLVRSSVDGDL